MIKFKPPYVEEVTYKMVCPMRNIKIMEVKENNEAIKTK
ncbi:hypothetical protein C240_1526 [Enterococcus sp. 5H]|nr:hypothetical protein [Enterococcus sp. 5H]